MIAVVVPSNRPERLEEFKKNWETLFRKHSVMLYVVTDGENPAVTTEHFNGDFHGGEFTVKEIMGDYEDLIYNFCDGVRNLGFALAYKDEHQIIISLDDDVAPVENEDPIQDHINALSLTVPLSWMNTTEENYMRGVPYGVRKEAEVQISHGCWYGVPDLDASSQLVLGEVKQTRVKSNVPSGVFLPMCIMNLAMTRKAIPYMYQAPAYGEYQRFSDIWGGIEAKKSMDGLGWGVVTGYAMVEHTRASNPFVNLIKEAKGIQMNENYGEGEYFELFFKQRERWQEFLKQYE